MNLRGLSGTMYQLGGAPIGSGGEGDVFHVQGDGSRVAKIYKAGTVSNELEEKLKIMTSNPPNESVLSQVAWPLDVVYDDGGKCVGFVMPKLSINAELGEVYKYPSRLPLSAQQKINIAQNICVVISEVHKAGYVFGDFNPRNIGLDMNTGLVSFLDTDTYHVADKANGSTYRCNVCAPGYAAPELLEKCSDYVAENPSASKNAYAKTPLPTFTRETDNFALAIHVFKLLMNGYTPFGGIIETASVSQSSPGVGDSAVRRDSYCFKPGFKHQSAAILPLEAFPQEIADLFTRAFIVGKHEPKRRPNAKEWHDALTDYYRTLVTCQKNALHQYDRMNVECPFCEADKRFVEAIGGVQNDVPLKQVPYLPPVETASKTVANLARIKKIPHSYVKKIGSALFARNTSGNSETHMQILERKLLWFFCNITLIVFLPLFILSSYFLLAEISDIAIGFMIYVSWMVFMSILGLKYCKNADKTMVLRFTGLLAIFLSIFLLPVFIAAVGDIGYVLIFTGTILSIIYLLCLVEDESYLMHAPGYLHIRVSCIALIIVSIGMSLLTYVFTRFLTILMAYYVAIIITLSYACYLLAFGVYGVKHIKNINKARLLRLFSIFGLNLSGTIILFSFVFSPSTLIINIYFATLGSALFIMCLIGVEKNLKPSATP